MATLKQQSIFHSFLYGGASVLLGIDLFFLVRALFSGNFLPLFPLLAGGLLAGGLILILYAEQKIREEDKKEHRRLSRVAGQLEAPLKVLQEDFAYLTSRARKLPAEERLKIKHMETKSKILLENIRDVFLMLRAQEGAISQEVRTYDLCTLLQDSIEKAKPLASAHNAELLYRAHCEDAPVKVDKRLFRIALMHLLENGIMYSLKPGLVNIAVARGQRQTRIIVQDRGVGVKEKDEGAIFQPFARGDKASQFDPDGIGVGLTLSRLIIEEFGGSLTWKNRQDTTGSTFEIKLPLAKR
ncbi:MAG: HAMP domain-containing histidine kinase [Candidatus Andersenbacteria bacterium]|nr:HAMP domain-containing histidine kinase [Candidatus Andersenbacteria bacterium]MBI3250645.1 HAMP domain-containing histidine kinase [Candidatus Andersenbacteria bacterium]